jgi:hypothetical protein
VARRRSELNVFSWSFLDAITCGFGAVVLTFVIINAQVADRAKESRADLHSETTRLEEQVLDARKNLVRLRNSLKDDQRDEQVLADEAARLAVMLARMQAEVSKSQGDSVARRESIEQLRADVKQLEESNQRLAARAAEKANTGQKLRSFTGEGNRQYLTGIRMGGSHVLILLDASASMLGRTYVNVVRFRSMPDARKVRAPKWQQAVRTVDWLTGQMKPGTKVQIYAFNEKARAVVDGTDGRWLDVKDGSELTAAVAAVRKLVPDKGTSLVNAFDVIKTLQPQPDNVFLITDGLPTQGDKAPAQPEDVKEERRVRYMLDATRSLPRRVPVNVLLFPMDGDPNAAGYFWDLAVASGGSFITPSQDWP